VLFLTGHPAPVGAGARLSALAIGYADRASCAARGSGDPPATFGALGFAFGCLTAPLLFYRDESAALGRGFVIDV
jgi:hypothetical protein